MILLYFFFANLSCDQRPRLQTIMSIDLDWLKLDASLASHVVDLLNRQLDSAERPSFIGPVQVVALDFGSNAPDVELIDLRDIYRDFLEDEDEDEHHPVKVTEGGDDDDDYEWVSRRAGVRQDPTPIGGSRQHYLPSHVRSRCHGTSGDHISPSMDPWTSGLTRPPSFSTYGMQSFSSASNEIPFYRSPSPATPFVMMPSPLHGHHTEHTPQTEPESSLDEAIPPPALTTEPLNPYPNLQLHLHVNWQSNIRISIQTSLLINYPSPMFMSLPIRLSITGLVFNGELAVAYEGRRKRVHLCILDDLDPYGPAGSRRMSNSSLNSPTPGVGTDQNTPLEPDDPIMGGSKSRVGGLCSSGPGNAALPSTTPNINSTLCMTSALGLGPLGHNPTTHTRPAKPGLPIGQRLLPSIFIESEIGQADKHVLKNVTRVEKFIQDVIRKTVEEELVFPSFHTLVMDESG